MHFVVHKNVSIILLSAFKKADLWGMLYGNKAVNTGMGNAGTEIEINVARMG